MARGFGTHISATSRQIFLKFSPLKIHLNFIHTLILSLCVCVRQGSRSRLLGDLRVAQEEGFCFGVKLVRGAYMDKERKLAKEEGREDPVRQSWEDTNERWSPKRCLLVWRFFLDMSDSSSLTIHHRNHKKDFSLQLQDTAYVALCLQPPEKP